MEQKRVTFKVAKAIKEAGYSQHPNISEYWYVTEHSEPIFDEPYEKAGTLVDDWDFATNMIAAPTYLDVWLWLWREKKACISILFAEGNCGIEIWYKKTFLRDFEDTFDPEEAIAGAIDYLVDNDLIK